MVCKWKVEKTSYNVYETEDKKKKQNLPQADAHKNKTMANSSLEHNLVFCYVVLYFCQR